MPGNSFSSRAGVVVGVIKDGMLVGGITYSAEEWDQKLRDDRAIRIEAKLDAIMARLGIHEGRLGP